MENREIRNYAKEKGVMLWELAEALGISDSYLSRKLRRDLPADKERVILKAIDKAAEYKELRGAELREEV